MSKATIVVTALTDGIALVDIRRGSRHFEALLDIESDAQGFRDFVSSARVTLRGPTGARGHRP